MNRYEVGGTVSVTLAQFEDSLDIRQLAKQPGCYVIQSPDRALYCGSSQVNMTARIQAHVNGRSTGYLHRRLLSAKRVQERITVMFCPVPPQQARLKEVEILGQLQPLYNSRQPRVRY